MALDSGSLSRSEEHPAPPEFKQGTAIRTVPPAWSGLVYLFGLLAVFLGERVLSATDRPRLVATVLGCVALVGAIVIRLIAGVLPATAERRRIERLLLVMELGGLLAVGVALLSSVGSRFLGLDAMVPHTAERVSAILQVGWVVLLLASVLPLSFAQVALLPMRRAERPESRRIRAAAGAGFTIALALSYLGLFAYVANRQGVAADYAYFKTARPSDSTRKIAQSLTQPIRVVAVFPQVNEVRNEVGAYLREVGRGAPKLNVEFIDRLLSPKVARELRISQDGVLVLVRGEARQVVTVGTEIKAARTVLRKLDEEFQKQLMKISRDARVTYLTTGHGELNDTKLGGAASKGRTVQLLRRLLEMQNYRVNDLGMAEGLSREVPADASVVMILGPREPFAPEEVATVASYMKRGGKLFVALDPEVLPTPETIEGGVPSAPEPSASSTRAVAPSPEAPSGDAAAATPTAPSGDVAAAAPANLDTLAALFGLRLVPTILANDREFVQRQFNKSDRTQLISNRFSSHASVSTLSRSSSFAVLFGTGALEKLDDKDKSIDFVIRSMTGTFADKNRSFELDGDETRGSYEYAAAVARKPDGSPADKKGDAKNEMRAFVMADADAVSDLVLGNVPTNRLMVLDAVRWLGGEESFAGEINSEEDVRIVHTKEKDAVWFYALILGVPLLVLASGLMLSGAARKKGGRL
jgi:hypothetical protein